MHCAMSVRKRAGFLSPNRIFEMICDSESEEAGASSYCIIYLGNRILRILNNRWNISALVTLSLTD